MKTVVVTALALLALLFLAPLALLGSSPAPAPAATLPPSPPPALQPASAGRDAGCALTVKTGDGQIKELSMEQYLWGVVAAEMPASFEPEALKAQAVAARTYAYSRIGKTPHNHPDADLCDNITCCQAYIETAAAAANWGDSAQTYAEKIKNAVSSTDGLVILYQGAPIDAVFHSSSAGRTLDAAEVWGNLVPYLTGVESPEGEEVPNYHTTVAFTPEEFRNAFLVQFPQADLSGSPTQWFGTVDRTSNGGVEEMEIGGVRVSGGALRALFSLRSSAFNITANEKAITFSVTGYGHGVGMSQYGANAMAKQGKTYDEIINWYYSGVSIEPYPQQQLT